MRQFRLLAAMALLLAMLLLCGGFAMSETILPATGPRVPENIGYMQATDLADEYGLDVEDWPPLYTPASPQPMNAYIVTHPKCINDLMPVSKKGLESIAGYLRTWANDITNATDSAIRFVSDPDNADILIGAKMSYSYAGTYSGGSETRVGYATTVQLTAWRLTDPDDFASMSRKNSPGRYVTLSSGSVFFLMPAPELRHTAELNGFVSELLSWYGYGSDFNDIKAMIAHYYPVAE